MSRRTAQRDAIRAAFEAAGRPLKPDEVLALAQDAVPGLGAATVYRNLRRLTDDGWLRAVNLPGEATQLYERADLAHHHHFHCETCDRVYDVHVCPGDLSHLAPAGFRVAAHELVLYGSCAACAAE